MSFYKNLGKFFKYQLITKVVVALAIVPMFGWMRSVIVEGKSVGVFTNLDVFKFFLTTRGFLFLVLIALTVFIEIIFELGGFITLSAKSRFDSGEPSYLSVLKYNLKLLPRMFSIGGIIMLAYMVVFVPLSGVGLKLSVLKGINIPNFILSEIQSNMTYAVIYAVIIVIMFFLSIKMIFIFQYMLIYNMTSIEAIKASSKLVSQNKMKFAKTMIGVSFFNFLFAGILLALWLLFIYIIANTVNMDRSHGRIIMIFLLLLQNAAIILFSVLFIPFECHHITDVFYMLTNEENEYPKIKNKSKRTFLDKVLSRKKSLISIILVFMILISIPIGIFTSFFFGYNRNLKVMAHRGYGYGVPENSISSIKKSIKEKIDYVEIDVQKTKDGKYILNHDKNFTRVAFGKPKEASERVGNLTYSQIRTFDIGSNFGPKYAGEKVPTIEDILDLCKGKIKINLELKEKVDSKMMDDLIKMVKERNMQNQVIFTSLDIKNVEYIEKKDSNLLTGLIYFVTLGKKENFISDYLIMEEREATDSNIFNLQIQGHKVIVWTVNTDESIEKFVKSEADGIISDNPLKIKQAIKENSMLNEKDLILSSFLEDIKIK